MVSLDKDLSERILLNIEELGYLFPEFKLEIIDGKLNMLGKGGFSSVYEMYYRENSQYKYVLKVIGFEKHVVTSEQFWNSARLQRFLSEECPYVCRILDAREVLVTLDDNGEIESIVEATEERWNEDGLHLQFILMEKLADIIRKDRFRNASIVYEKLGNEDEVVEFATQIGQALLTAHNNNILHRDIKLENIFYDEQENIYKLGDFGIAKYVEGGNAETVVYTDGYGAPEIERRLNDYYNATADIYSFGITLYLLLNDLCFPGSEGYYSNIVQYDPKFIFPAPKNASENMTKVIRKMCAFNTEDRYQSMAEVLMDLKRIKEIDGISNEASEDLLDLETETFREEKVDKASENKSETLSRAERKKEEKLSNEIYNKRSLFLLVGISVFVTFFIKGMQVEAEFVSRWEFWLFPILVLIEALLLRIKEFHIIFGGITAVFGVYSMCVTGITVPHVMLMICVLIGVPILNAATSLAVGIWIFALITERIKWLAFFERHDLSWVALVVILILVYLLFILRMSFNKTSYRRAYLAVYIYDKMFLAMILAGIVVIVLAHFNIITIYDWLQRLHLVRTGITGFVLYVIVASFTGLLDEEEDAEEESIDGKQLDD